jgi:hypothetical protein
MEDVTLHFQGRRLSREEAAQYPIIVPRADFLNPGIASVFDSETSFLMWAEQTRHASRISEVVGKIAAARKLQRSDSSKLMERKKVRLDRTIEDLKSLTEKTGLDMGSEELFLRATSPGQTYPLEDPIFDPIMLCDGPGFNCAIPFVNLLPLGGGGWPDLGWVGWNDRASSFRVSGFALLYANPWWTGRAIFLTGHPVWAGNLADYDFDDITSSAWVA